MPMSNTTATNNRSVPKGGGAALVHVLTLAASLVAIALPPRSTSAKECTPVQAGGSGNTKIEAVKSAQDALSALIAKHPANRGGTATVKANKPALAPYFTSEVSTELLLKPDVITETSHTSCYKSEVSPVVCTAGAKLC
jgi:hypothetical protein